MDTGHRSPLRVLAPVALVIFGLALVLVVATSGGGDESAGRDASAAEEARDLGTNAKDDTQSKRAETTPDESEEELGDDVYVVKRGDTLGGIAEETGVPVERLEELNPGLDQFSLVAGQRIKLR
jgi:LysM repeat protein